MLPLGLLADLGVLSHFVVVVVVVVSCRRGGREGEVVNRSPG